MNQEIIQEIFVEDIIPNRFQPRLTFDEKALQELSDSIKQHGVIQPLVLRRVGNKYEIIAGERRYKASCMAGLKKVPAIVREMSDDESAEVALIENVQRKNLTSIEEAQSYRNLLDRGYMTQDDLAQKIGVSQSTIANKMRLLNLCDEVQNALLNEQISERHARSLLQLSNPDDQKNMLNRVIKERLTVKQLDNEIKKFLSGDKGTNDDGNESGAMRVEPVENNNTDISQVQPSKNIFGINIEPPTDLEATAPNLNTAVDDSIPPVSFNPFSSSPMDTNVDSEAQSTNTFFTNSDSVPVIDNFNNNPMTDIQIETGVVEPAASNNNPINMEFNSDEQLETFDMFGDIITPTPESVDIENVQAPPHSIGDQINAVRETIKNVESSGFVVEMEEYDFEDMYQMIIKIKK